MKSPVLLVPSLLRYLGLPAPEVTVLLGVWILVSLSAWIACTGGHCSPWGLDSGLLECFALLYCPWRRHAQLVRL